MKNIVIFLILAFAITGLLTPSMFSSSFASPEDAPGRDKGTKTAKGCDNGTAKNNPNCSVGSLDTDNDEIPDNLDACIYQPVENWLPTGEPDHDNDGIADSLDLSPCL
jgi:hypothetical protein